MDIFDKTAGAARLSITASGNVGIGTTSPSATFAVQGNGYFSNGLSALSATTTNFFASNLTGDVEPLGGNTFSLLNNVLGRVITPADFGAVGDTQRKSCTVTATASSQTLAVSGCSFSSSDVGKYLVVMGAGTASAPLTTTITGYTNSSTITMGAAAQTTLSAQSEYVSWGHDDSTAINAALVAEASNSSSNNASCVYLPPAPNGFWGVASPITLDPNGTPSCLRGAGMYQSVILALASVPEVLNKNTSYVYGGTVEDVGFDGNAIATNTVYLACAERLEFTTDRFANAGSNADLVVGDNVTGGCNTDHFDSDVLENKTYLYPNASSLPPYNVYVNTSDSYFDDTECVNAATTNFYTNSNSYNTYLDDVHCWNSPGYYTQTMYNINASAHLISPWIDGVQNIGILINAPDVQVSDGGEIDVSSSTATIGVEIAPNTTNVTVSGFDAQSSLSTAANRVLAELPMGSGVHIFSNPGAYDYNLMAQLSPVDNQTISLGPNALANLSTTSQIYSDIGIGYAAGGNTSSSFDSIFIGYDAGLNTSNQNVAVGWSALKGQSGGGTNGNVAIGFQADTNNTTGSKNTIVGDTAAYALTSGQFNDFIGFQTASTTQTGSNNIALGYNIDLPSTNGSNQLDIGNLIYGTGVNGALSTVSTGNISIGTTTPYSKLEVWGSDTASTSAFAVVNSASTTVFSVYDNGNATYSGSIFQSSDQRLKTNITSLDPSSSLATIDALNPVSYIRLDQNTGTNLGFIAQQVQTIFPDLVSTTSATALTPNGTLTLNYVGLIAPIVKAIQSLATTVSGFAQSITSAVGNFGQVHTKELCVAKSDGSEVCITGDQLGSLLSNGGQQTVEVSAPAPLIVPDDTSTTTSDTVSTPGQATSSDSADSVQATSTDASSTPQ